MKETEMELMQPQEQREITGPAAVVGPLFEGIPSQSIKSEEAVASFQQRMMVEVPLINGEPPASLSQGWTRDCQRTEPPLVSFPESMPPARMTPQEEAAQRRREKNKFRMRALRASETEVARRLREKNKLRMRRLRASQSQVAQRLKERNAFRMRSIRAAGSAEKLRPSDARLKQQIAQLPLQMPPGTEVTAVPLLSEWTCLCHQLYAPSQTDAEVERRRERGRLRMRMLRSSETKEQAARRRELNRLRMRQKRNSQKLAASLC